MNRSCSSRPGNPRSRAAGITQTSFPTGTKVSRFSRALAMLTMHFRLDGQLLWFANGEELLQRANQGEHGVHVDVALELDKGVLGFADRRHFGRVHAWTSADDCPGLSILGIDAFSRDFTSSRLIELLAASKRPLKGFLLDQSRVAGIGNIYSCESLWHARLEPRRRANTLQPQE